MTQFKILLLGISALVMSGIIGAASVSAQAANPTVAPTSPEQPQAAKPAMTTAPVQVAETVPAKRVDRIICKEDMILGTRLKGQRTCRTASEWRRISRGFQARLKETNDRAGAAFSGS